MKLYLFLLGFFGFGLIGTNILLGYASVAGLAKRLARGEEIADAVDKIHSRHRGIYPVALAVELPVISVLALYRAELGRSHYAYNAVYLLLAIVCVALSLIPQAAFSLWWTFFGATVFSAGLLIFKLLADANLAKALAKSAVLPLKK